MNALHSIHCSECVKSILVYWLKYIECFTFVEAFSQHEHGFQTRLTSRGNSKSQKFLFLITENVIANVYSASSEDSVKLGTLQADKKLWKRNVNYKWFVNPKLAKITKRTSSVSLRKLSLIQNKLNRTGRIMQCNPIHVGSQESKSDWGLATLRCGSLSPEDVVPWRGHSHFPVHQSCFHENTSGSFPRDRHCWLSVRLTPVNKCIDLGQFPFKSNYTWRGNCIQTT